MRVVVTDGRRFVMERDLRGALDRLVAEGEGEGQSSATDQIRNRLLEASSR